MASRKFYLSSLDGARAISIGWVMFAHLGFGKFSPAGLGVNIFFFISGFLITLLLIKEYQNTEKVNLKNFYIRRALRLLPPLFFLLIVTGAVSPLTHFYLTFKNQISPAIFYYQNYYNCFHDDKSPLSSLWSLAVEEHFYLFFPLLFTIFFKSPKKILITTLIIIIFSNIDRIAVSAINHQDLFAKKYTYYATDARLDSIMIGCLTSLLIFFMKDGSYVKFVSPYWMFFLALALLLSATIVFRGDFFRQTLCYSLQSISLMVIVPAFIYGDKYKLLNKILSSRLLVWIGKLSYSLYLFHILVFDFVKSNLRMTEGTLPYCATALLASFGIASFSYYFVEKPIMKLRTRFGSNIQTQKVA